MGGKIIFFSVIGHGSLWAISYGRIYLSEIYQAKYDIQGSFRPILLTKTIAATFLIVRFWSSYSKMAIFIV